MTMRRSLPELVRLAYQLGYCTSRPEQRRMNPAALHRNLIRHSDKGGAWPKGMKLVENLSEHNFKELVEYILAQPPARLHGAIRAELRGRLIRGNYNRRLMALIEEQTQ